MNGIQWGRIDPTSVTENIIIVASGKSLQGFDLNRLRGLGHIITINGSGDQVPFANAWFTLDPWGLNGPQLPKNFQGKLFAAVGEDYGTSHALVEQHRVTPIPGITFLHRLRQHNFTNVSSETAWKLGLSEDTSCISTGNSGYGAFNLAYHYRPKKILLLGIDGGMGYFYTNSKSNRALTHLPKMFDSTKEQIERAGIQVINGSKESAITTYDRMRIGDALREFAQ